jgi:RNA polymerase sigma-70 factor (ECF subfamily)
LPDVSLSNESIDRLFRRESGRAVAALVQRFGDLELAEECVQEAFIEALERWPGAGLPDNPGAWITTVARNRALDRLRRTKTGAEKVNELAVLGTRGTGDSGGSIGPLSPVDEEFEDNRLRLILMCCHPALSTEARVALTLNLVAGLPVDDIARAFLVPPPTMSKRLVRAKRKVREARIPFDIPTDEEALADRVSSAQAVIYLVFSEGYSANSGDEPVRAELCDEAIFVARLLRIFRPNDSDQAALLALLLLQDSRRDARLDADGELVLLADQDRSRWDRAKIDEGLALLDEAFANRNVGVYTLQAAIASEHAIAPGEAQTDWSSIATLYARLGELVPNPVFEVNRAVAIGMAHGPAAGLEVLELVEAQGSVDDYAPLHLVRADLSKKLARNAEAAAAFRAALKLSLNDAQRAYIEQQLVELGD